MTAKALATKRAAVVASPVMPHTVEVHEHPDHDRLSQSKTAQDVGRVSKQHSPNPTSGHSSKKRKAGQSSAPPTTSPLRPQGVSQNVHDEAIGSSFQYDDFQDDEEYPDTKPTMPISQSKRVASDSSADRKPTQKKQKVNRRSDRNRTPKLGHSSNGASPHGDWLPQPQIGISSRPLQPKKQQVRSEPDQLANSAASSLLDGSSADLAESKAVDADEATKLTTAAQMLAGNGRLDKQTILSVITYFLSYTGMRVVDVGQVPEISYQSTSFPPGCRPIKLRGSDKVILVPLFHQELQQYQLLAYSITPSTLKVTYYVARIHIGNVAGGEERAARDIARVLEICPEKELRFDRAVIINSLRQFYAHECGIVVIIQALYLISPTKVPVGVDIGIWSMFIRCCLQRGRLSEELDTTFASKMEIPQQPITQLLHNHAAADTRYTRVVLAQWQAEDFCELVKAIELRMSDSNVDLERASEGVTERRSFLQLLEDNMVPALSAKECRACDISRRGLKDAECNLEAVERSVRGAKAKSKSFARVASDAASIRLQFKKEAHLAGKSLDKARRTITEAAKSARRILQEAKLHMQMMEQKAKEANKKARDAHDKAKAAASDAKKVDMDSAALLEYVKLWK